MTLTINEITKGLKTEPASQNSVLWPFTQEISKIFPLQKAAVLMPLLQEAGEWHLLFIRRTRNHNDRHSGQVAFPGGRADNGDKNLLATALREAEEEIKLHPSDVTVLGQLSDLLTISNYQVSPIVGQIPWPYALEPDSNEVARTFTIPLRWLADSNNYEVRPWTPLPGKVEPYPIIFYDEFKGETLWGASARMVMELMERLNILSVNLH